MESETQKEKPEISELQKELFQDLLRSYKHVIRDAKIPVDIYRKRKAEFQSGIKPIPVLPGMLDEVARQKMHIRSASIDCTWSGIFSNI